MKHSNMVYGIICFLIAMIIGGIIIDNIGDTYTWIDKKIEEKGYSWYPAGEYGSDPIAPYPYIYNIPLMGGIVLFIMLSAMFLSRDIKEVKIT